ncbi:MAG: polysaccharide deacetylase family protein [Candidatus Omnitrophica bacterium]|nr:polysaccharide deacetylase family protein [Candidatus Omnitrophota bacterium]
MKRPKKPQNKPSSKKSPENKPLPVLATPHTSDKKISNKKWFLLGGVCLLVLGIAFLVLKRPSPSKDVDLTTIPWNHERMTEGFVENSVDLSRRLTVEGSQKLRASKPREAIEDYKRAIEVYPLNSRAYGYLVEFYMMTKREEEMFRILTLAGRSFPDFNQIVSMIKDSVIDRWPLEEHKDSVFIANFFENKKMAISFMFDDGENSVYDKALPVMDKYGFRATIPVVAGRVVNDDNDLYWGSWHEWKDAAKRGFEIANHSMYHRDIRDLHGEELDLATDGAKALIEKTTGSSVSTYVFPYDRYEAESVKAALHSHQFIRTNEFLSALYKKAFVIVYGGPRISVDTANRLVDIGIKRRLWIVAECHGILVKGRPSFKSMTEEFLNAHLGYIHSKLDDVWIDTFATIAKYQSLRGQTKVEVKNLKGRSADFILHNPSVPKGASRLTVVLKTESADSVKSATTAGGRRLKAWSCDAKALCVNVDSYEENIHLEF